MGGQGWPGGGPPGGAADRGGAIGRSFRKFAMASAMCTVEKTSSGREYKVKDINEADFGTPRPAARANPPQAHAVRARADLTAAPHAAPQRRPHGA